MRFDSTLLRGDLSGKLLQFTNCRSLRGLRFTDDDVMVEDGRIVDAAIVFYDQQRLPDIQIDCMGHIIAPGFIDIQINGGFLFLSLMHSIFCFILILFLYLASFLSKKGTFFLCYL